jgi:hypothetical protein
MKGGNRRGQAVADALRVFIRQEEEADGSGSEPDGSNSPASPDSPDSPDTPSPPSSPTGDAPPAQQSDPAALPPTTDAPAPTDAPSATAVLPPTEPTDAASASSATDAAPTDAPSAPADPAIVPPASTSSIDGLPIDSISSSILTSSIAPSLVPTTLETRTISLPATTTDNADNVLRPSEEPFREGVDNSGTSGSAEATQRMSTITGGVIGGLAGLILIIALIICLRKRKKNKNNQNEDVPRGFPGATTRSQKSHSTVLDQVITAVYSWGDRRSVNKGNQDADWYPQEKAGGDTASAAGDPVNTWLNKVGNYAPSFRASRASFASSGKAGWDASRGDGRYQEIGDDMQGFNQPAQHPVPVPPIPTEHLVPPPQTARRQSLTAPTVVSRYTINSQSTWAKWG